MSDLLFLSDHAPAPPIDGGGARTWYMLGHLAQRHRVHLGCMIEDPDDRSVLDRIRRLCAETCFAARPGTELAAWAERVAEEHRVEFAVAVSAAMGGHVPRAAPSIRRRVIDMVRVESDLWRRDASRRPWPLSLLAKRRGQRHLVKQRDAARQFDVILFASQAQASRFRELAPETAARVDHLCDGVDAEHFSPRHDDANPFQNDRGAIVLAGAMDRPSAIEAATWFVGDVLPALRARGLQIALWIVGARPAPAVRRLARPSQVMVTGAVTDIRPYLAHAAVVVAPWQTVEDAPMSVLAAMAMARPVVATPQAIEGLPADPGNDVALASGARGFALAVAAALAGKGAVAMGVRARQRVLASCDWDMQLARLDAALEG